MHYGLERLVADKSKQLLAAILLFIYRDFFVNDIFNCSIRQTTILKIKNIFSWSLAYPLYPKAIFLNGVFFHDEKKLWSNKSRLKENWLLRNEIVILWKHVLAESPHPERRV